MSSGSAVLLAALVALVIIVVAQNAGWVKTFKPDSEGFVGMHPDGAIVDIKGRAAGNRHLDSIRGQANHGFNQPRADPRYQRQGPSATPEDIAEEEREMWFAATQAGHTSGYNTEEAFCVSSDTIQYHTQEPGMDYNGHITDLISGPRMRQNHANWVDEMRPWGGTTMKVDTLDVENYVPFTGLRRPQAVHQSDNRLFITEVDEGDLARHNKFNFQG